MEITIEKYRGFEIIFDTDNEKFTYSTDGIGWNEKQSYSACKKSIDDYLKNNHDFKPFHIRHKRCGQLLEIVGIRKDGRFIYEKEGKKEQLSSYSESDYIIYDKEDDIIYLTIEGLEKQIDVLNASIKLELGKVKGESLKDAKKYLITP